MKFLTVRDIRNQPKEMWKKLSEDHELVITNHGKPNALMIEIDEENMLDVILVSDDQWLCERRTS